MWSGLRETEIEIERERWLYEREETEKEIQTYTDAWEQHKGFSTEEPFTSDFLVALVV